MVQIYITKKGYYYKEYKNGVKKRISMDEYLRKRKKKIHIGGGITENQFSNKSLITDSSTEGLIWKVKYKNNDHVFKEFKMRDIRKKNDDDINIHDLKTQLQELTFKEKGEIRKLELPLYTFLSQNDNILKIYDIVLDAEGNFRGLLMEYLDGDWVTIGEFCKSEVTVDKELIKKIGDAFLDALYFLNRYGFSIDHIEHYDNVMINTKTHDIKLIDIDGISEKPFINREKDKRSFARIFVSRNTDIDIPTSTLCKQILDYINHLYNLNSNINSNVNSNIKQILIKISEINKEYEDARNKLSIKREMIIAKKQDEIKQKFITNFSNKTVSEQYKLVLSNERLFFSPVAKWDLNMLMSNPISLWSKIAIAPGGFKQRLIRLIEKYKSEESSD